MKHALPLFVLLSFFEIACTSPVTRRPSSTPVDVAVGVQSKDLVNQALARIEKTPSIARFLASFEQVSPEHFKHYALAYKSKSLHGSTVTSPRVILFGTDASMIVTYNGQVSLKGYAALETMTFHGVTGKYEFREYLFKNDVPADEKARQDFKETVLDDDIAWENYAKVRKHKKVSADAKEISFDSLPPVLISRANPQKCAMCHGAGESSTPIWENYFVWPGFYGSDADQHLFSLSEHGRALKYPKEGPSEAQAYREFMKTRKKNPRYALLQSAKPMDPNDAVLRPNEILTNHFANQSMTRIKWKIVSLYSENPNGSVKLRKLRATVLRYFCEMASMNVEGPEQYQDFGSKIVASFDCQNRPANSVCARIVRKYSTTASSDILKEQRHVLRENGFPFEEGNGFDDHAPVAMDFILANIYDLAGESKSDFNFDLHRRNDVFISHLSQLLQTDAIRDKILDQAFMMIRWRHKKDLTCEKVKTESERELNQDANIFFGE